VGKNNLCLLPMSLWYNDKRNIYENSRMQAERVDHMEALRKVVRGTDLPNSFELPENFRKKNLEIIIIPLEDNSVNKKDLKKAGSLSEYAKPELIEYEKTAWEKASRVGKPNCYSKI
jgi:hypothetical protein